MDCWESFKRQDVELPAGWDSEWADTPFRTEHPSTEALERDWERVRISFISDSRTLGELEALTGRQWMGRHRGEQVQKYAGLPWADLKGPGGRRLKNIRNLVDLLSAAAKPDGGTASVGSIAGHIVVADQTGPLTNLPTEQVSDA